MFTANRTILALSLAVTAVSTVTPTQSASPPAQNTSPLPLPPMATDANPTFEVATIKPSDTSAPHGRFIRLDGRHVIAYNMSVKDLIIYAYGIQAKQIVDGNPRLLAKNFDIDG